MMTETGDNLNEFPGLGIGGIKMESIEKLNRIQRKMQTRRSKKLDQ